MRRLQLTLMVGLLSVSSSFAGARLGGTMDEFHAAWGPPTSQERVDRTARLVWGPFEQRTKLPPGIREANVRFLDRVACTIVLRGRAGVSETWDWVIKHVCQILPNCPKEFPRPHPTLTGSREFSLKDGTFIAVRQFKERTIIIIEGRSFFQNEEVFIKETAIIHPPKAEH